MKDSDSLVITTVAHEMYEIAADHGFHRDSPELGTSEPVTIERVAKFCANLHGEASELWEAARKGKLNDLCDKKGCDLTCAEEELADLVIRAMDCAVVLGVDLGAAIRVKSQYNKTRPYMHGKTA
jgi:NTP pyrophosphatase (non-canonical NTP hydrolase)